MFVEFDRGVRVHVGVVALGNPPRLRTCLETLVDHASVHDFAVSCLVNPTSTGDAVDPVTAPPGVRVEHPASNLGWGAGLHRLRALSDGEYFVWVQDDMSPLEGWLDALVAAADAHPRVGVLGAVRVGDDGAVMLHNGGLALPADRVEDWNATDTSAESPPEELTLLDWVTSKGSLTRTAAFDEVAGPDPRLWPLNHVDKDYSTHLRCHGWDAALVPGARLTHLQSQSSPPIFRDFLGGWRDAWFNQRWAGPVAELSGRTSGAVAHPCAEWRAESSDPAESAAGREATRMLVPFARRRAAEEATKAAEAEARETELLARLAEQEAIHHAEHAATLAAYEIAVAELGRAEEGRQRAVLRSRRRRRRLLAAQRRIAVLERSRSRRLVASLRGVVRRLR